jgi:hypothetical protein
VGVLTTTSNPEAEAMLADPFPVPLDVKKAAAVPAAPAMITADSATATNRRLELKILLMVTSPIAVVGYWALLLA